MRVYVYIAFKVCSYFNSKGGNLWPFKLCHLFNKLFFTNCCFFCKLTDVIAGGILKMMFCTLTLIFAIFTLVLMIEQQFGLIGMVIFPCSQTHTYPKPPE